MQAEIEFQGISGRFESWTYKEGNLVGTPMDTTRDTTSEKITVYSVIKQCSNVKSVKEDTLKIGCFKSSSPNPLEYYNSGNSIQSILSNEILSGIIIQQDESSFKMDGRNAHSTGLRKSNSMILRLSAASFTKMKDKWIVEVKGSEVKTMLIEFRESNFIEDTQGWPALIESSGKRFLEFLPITNEATIRITLKQ